MEQEQRQEKTKPKHASPGESSAHSMYRGKSALNGSESEDQHFHGKILHRENGQEEKTKKKVKKRQCEVLEGGDLVRETVNTENRAEEKKKKKNRKEKSREQLEEGIFLKDIAEELKEDEFLREQEKSTEKRRKKEKKKKKRKMKEDGDKELQEEDQRWHPQRENATLMKVTFEDPIVAADQEQVRDILNEAERSSSEILMDDVEEIWGVRFTPEEDETLKNAVWKYIKSKGWDEHVGLDKVFNSKKHKDARDCWAEIKMSLPHRPRQAVRFRARLLLETGNHLGKWSKEEEDLLKRLVSERGRKWREFSFILNRQRSCIKEKWRSLKRADTLKVKGGWAQDELQKLSNMVHNSLRKNRLLASKKEKPDRHILRDNIAWENIANALGTHNHGPCCSKWYYNLQSSLVADGHWASQDDVFLLERLLESGASAEEEVEWDELLEHRSGQVCSTRWKQMVKHLGENRTRQFLDKLDILARRYAPELLETSVEDSISKELPSQAS